MALVPLSLLLLALSVTPSHQEVFTAVVDLRPLLGIQASILEALDTYIRAEEARLSELRTLSEKYIEIKDIASYDVESFLGNPINAFVLIKSLTKSWEKVQNLVSENATQLERSNLLDLSLNRSFPTKADMSGAVDALVRLQHVYQLDPDALAGGIIKAQNGLGADSMNQSVPIPFTAEDCYDIGRACYNTQKYYHYAKRWAEVAKKSVSLELVRTIEGAKIAKFLKLIKYDEKHFIREMYAAEEEFEKSLEDRKSSDGYEALCRGDIPYFFANNRTVLSCYFEEATKSAYMKLMHVKAEEASKEPRIILYHDVLSDSEIAIFTRLSRPRLRRSLVATYGDDKAERAPKYRISKNAWLHAEDHEAVARAEQRVQDITGLAVSTAEEFQVANYGLGGQYEPHYDCDTPEEGEEPEDDEGVGDRIATWMYYLSDVEAGGATVFPLVGVTAWPRKGSAVFWYNLKRNGRADLRTLHAGCPVLSGSKWIATKWLHETGQEFRRPCGLVKDA